MSASQSFSQFMARALYDPEKGYYTRHIRTVGTRGDFSTSATLSPAFGQAVAQWLKAEARLQPSVRDIIEIGAGSGDLMATVRKNFSWWQRRRFRWHIVETSPVLQGAQKQKLGAGITWHSRLEDALTASQNKGFIYHNEVLDAFPARLLQYQEGLWHEVFLDGRLQEVLQPLQMQEEATAYSALGEWPQRPAKQRVELHTSVRDWMRNWSSYWRVGAMLTVDYGDVFPDLYHRRPAGSLRAYLHQHRLEGPAVYQNPGRQDLTADVNFSDYRNWAHELGWQEAAYGTQTEFLSRYGIKINPNDPRTAFIMNSGGAGEAFKHVIHRVPA